MQTLIFMASPIVFAFIMIWTDWVWQGGIPLFSKQGPIAYMWWVKKENIKGYLKRAR